MEPKDLTDWQKALKSVLNSSEMTLKIGNNDRLQFLKKHTWIARGKEILRLMETLK